MNVFCLLLAAGIISRATLEDVKNINEVSLLSDEFENDMFESASTLNKNENVDKKKETFQEKKEKFGELRKTAKEKLKKFGAEEVTKSIEGVSKGLTQLVSGVKSGSWQDMLLGGLSIIGSLASLAGPLGAAISNILSIVSMVFGLFSGSKEAVESQEGMLKRVIDEALTRSRADELRAEAAGLKKAINSVRNSINLFREEKFKKINENQATELYNQAFRGLPFFGQLNYAIDKYCDCTVENENKTEKITKARENSARCLEFINLYADLSILRQLLIADLASLVGSVDLEATAINLIKLNEKEQASDKEIFQFLLDPIAYKPQRFCTAQFFGQPDKYPVLQAYLESISKQVQHGENKKSNNLVVCSQRELLGHCYKLKNKNYTKSDLQEWSGGGIKSIYISLAAGSGITGYSGENYNGSIYGPFHGQSVFGVTPGGSWNSIKISALQYEYDEFVRVCDHESLSQGGRCDVLEATFYHDLLMTNRLDDGVYTLKSKKCIFPFNYGGKHYLKCTKDEAKSYWCATEVTEGGEMKTYDDCALPRDWSDKIKSMSIPENFQVKLFTEENFKGDMYGPFYGTNIIDKVCTDQIKSAQITINDKKSSEMVKICKKESFIMCDLIEIGEYPNLNIHNCSYEDKENKIKSTRVPSGLSVYMWTKKNFTGRAIGPYIGPLSVAIIDGGEPETEGDSNHQVSSMKVVRSAQVDGTEEISKTETTENSESSEPRLNKNSKKLTRKHQSTHKKLRKHEKRSNKRKE